MPKSSNSGRAAITVGVNRGVIRGLKAAKTGKCGPIVACARDGYGDGIVILTAWLLFRISRRLSANYHMFGGVGDFQLRRVPQIQRTRRELRRLINHAINVGILNKRRPEFMFKVDASALEIPNAAPDPRRRLDVALLGWERYDGAVEVLVPTSWLGAVQIHPCHTYRLTEDFESTMLKAWLGFGETILNMTKEGDMLDKELERVIRAGWSRLKDYATKQHSEAKQHYRLQIDKVDLSGGLMVQAKALFLTASLTRIGSPSRLIDYGEVLQTIRDEYGEHVSKRSKTF